MAGIRNLEINGTTDIEAVTFNGQEVVKVVYDGETVWENASDWGSITYLYNGTEKVYSPTTQAEMNDLCIRIPGFGSEKVTLGNGDEIAFNSISAVRVGESYTILPAQWFQSRGSVYLWNSPNPTSLILPSTLREIGESFGSASEVLANLIIPAGVTTIKARFYSGSGSARNQAHKVTLPSSVTDIGARFFTPSSDGVAGARDYPITIEVNCTALPPDIALPEATSSTIPSGLSMTWISERDSEEVPAENEYTYHLTGSQAAYWKQNIPDANGYTVTVGSHFYKLYRKLIVDN